MKGKHSNLQWLLTCLTLARGIVLHLKVILLCLLQSQDLALCWQAGWECHFRRLRGSRESPDCCGMLQLLPEQEGWASPPGSSAAPLGNLSSHASVPLHALPFPEPPISEARKITERKEKKKSQSCMRKRPHQCCHQSSNMWAKAQGRDVKTVLERKWARSLRVPACWEGQNWLKEWSLKEVEMRPVCLLTPMWGTESKHIPIYQLWAFKHKQPLICLMSRFCSWSFPSQI